MSRTYDRTTHGHLILKLVNGRIGIWSLNTNTWHRRPWTSSSTDAYQGLRKARISLAEPTGSVWPLRLAFALAAAAAACVWLLN